MMCILVILIGIKWTPHCSYILTFQQIQKHFSTIATKLRAKDAHYLCNCTLLLHLNHFCVTAENNANIVAILPQQHIKCLNSIAPLTFSYTICSISICFCWDSLTDKPPQLGCSNIINTKGR